VTRAALRAVLRTFRAVLRPVVFFVAMFLSILLMPPSAHSGGAVIDNASLFADFAVAHDKSITFRH
jgi:hypothetical protein